MSVKKFAGCALAAAVVSVLSVPAAHAAATLMVNDEAPLATPGFSYVTTGTATNLDVSTGGYLFCANVYYPPTVPSANVVLAPMHTRWTLPTAFDVQTATYTGGVLRVNKPLTGASLETSLTCHARGPNGEIANPYSGYGAGVFADGLEASQYAKMVNWIPAPGFNWSAPDWSQVPADPCNFDNSTTDSPIDPETSLCAAATGVSPGGTGGVGVRAATMWTQVVGSSFIYVARIDGRLGAQTSGPNANFGTLMSTQGVQDSSNAVDTAIRDGFDSTYLSATETSSYCLLDRLPTALTTSICNGAPVSGSFNGTLQAKFTLSMFFPTAPATSFYVAVIRPVIGGLPPANTPVAAISVMADPGTVRHDGGDGFMGDDVVFGFPNGGGFSWMGGQ
jgi:hypothetical protein